MGSIIKYGKKQLGHLGVLSIFTFAAQESIAACNLIPAAGDNSYICDSGAYSGDLTDTGGNNTLIFPQSGSGVIDGSVNFGAGVDTIEMHSGSILGEVYQGDSPDRFVITGGTVTGGVHQGNGIDDFVMSGGTIKSLSQGDNHDTFLMTGGTITGVFEDGDTARMTGGTIGRVDMKLDNNLFDMSGGEIIGNLVTGFGHDTIIISNGRVGGNISVSGGDDSITVSGGVVEGEIRASAGNDSFTWSGGEIKSAILMGEGDDTASLSGLNESLLSAVPNLDGGTGTDRLTFNATTSASPGRYTHWESIELNNGSNLQLNGALSLGDADTGSGRLSVSTDSSVLVDQGSVRPFDGAQLATVNNAGTIDLAHTASASNRLSIFGNYIGSGGLIRLNSVLGDDSSASDRLVISNGIASGQTTLEVSNLSGQGGATVVDGIHVVEAINNGSTTADAFSLKGAVSAGAYDYYLFKGGVSAGTAENWYLRSTVVAAPEPPVTEPGSPVPPVVPQPAPGTPSLPVPQPGEAPIPIYRQEVPVYSMVIPAAQVLALETVGTFHERQGEQSLLIEKGVLAAGWGRAYTSDLRQSWSGSAAPSFDGSNKGYQVGHDLYSAEHEDGWRQRYGFFLGQSRLDGDIKGFSGGFMDRKSGKAKLEGDSFGAYATFITAEEAYLDLVVMTTRVDGHARSDRGVRLDTEGDVLTLSAEAGYPLKVSEHWVLEPQIQIINQRVDLDSQHDGISSVGFDSDDYWIGRAGVRARGRYLQGDMLTEPYIRANLWHTFEGQDTVTYDAVDRLQTEHKSTSAALELGMVAHLSSSVSVHLAVDYNANLDSNDLEGFGGNLGVRFSW
jgi:outer membrane autotransporter protein